MNNRCSQAKKENQFSNVMCAIMQFPSFKWNFPFTCRQLETYFWWVNILPSTKKKVLWHEFLLFCQVPISCDDTQHDHCNLRKTTVIDSLDSIHYLKIKHFAKYNRMCFLATLAFLGSGRLCKIVSIWICLCRTKNEWSLVGITCSTRAAFSMW